ncbi:GDP-mannose 4,6-dehydratase [Salipaludibacillus keqinensis]|uniref:GDP-mannose 4,6-dehydratase n=1 Tax=Salipaludibacillus keqinensis TaxID=2045207 RepID=UPI001E5010E9|nr:GDP-mannose 4,6-dehydratase [Salipaludibacillus keqinensis]
MNDYYDTQLKRDRLEILLPFDSFTFYEGEIDVVINLAAQVGVRYSLENPHAYIDSNILGFMIVFEACRH